MHDGLKRIHKSLLPDVKITRCPGFDPMMFADLADAEHMWVELHRCFGVPFDECECDILPVENEPGDEDGREDE